MGLCRASCKRHPGHAHHGGALTLPEDSHEFKPILERMDDMIIDFGKTAADYGRHRAGFPREFFERLFRFGVVAAGDRVLDLGTGTGTIARGLARGGCAVVGLDPSPDLLNEARRLSATKGASIDYALGRAEETGQPDRAFDAVIAAQCWHWFNAAHAAAEARRTLKPLGRLVMASFDWLPLPGSVVEATEQLILAHNPQWRFHGGNGVHVEWFADLAAGGFLGAECFGFDYAAPYTHEGWLGRIRASAGVGASLSPKEIERFDKAHALLLAERFPEQPLETPHRVFCTYGRAPD
ncbi:MAG TPA: class I SAM-dependent methyltransferase [Methylocella sp.]|nr:class I SAM-dependent methyltransferase [Methylocella sp.]